MKLIIRILALILLTAAAACRPGATFTDPQDAQQQCRELMSQSRQLLEDQKYDSALDKALLALSIADANNLDEETRVAVEFLSYTAAETKGLKLMEHRMRRNRMIRRKYHVTVVILIIVLAIILLSIIGSRYNVTLRANKKLHAENRLKQQIIDLITMEIKDPGKNPGTSIAEFTRECIGLDDEQIQERCKALVSKADDLNNDIARYISEIIISKKKESMALGLTERELEIIRLSAQELSTCEIAEKLSISTRTVSNHKQSIYSKMGVCSNTAMIKKAIELGIA